MKHRLFWKFLLAFWLTLLVVAVLAALGGRLLEQHFGDESSALDTGPRAAMLLDTAQATLAHAGANTLKTLLRDVTMRRHDVVYVVDPEGRDLLGRPLPQTSFQEALRITAGTSVSADAGGNGAQGGLITRFRPVRGARRVSDAQGREWLLFVPEFHASRLGGPRHDGDDFGRPPPPPALEPGIHPEDWLVMPGPPPGPPPAPTHGGGFEGGEPPRQGLGEPPRSDAPGAGEADAFRPGPPQGDGFHPGPPHRSRKGFDDLDSTQAQAVLIGLVLVASFVFAALLAWSMTRPLRTLRQAFDAAAAGRLETRVKDKMGPVRDEITELGGHFDHMVEQIQSLLQSQQRLLHDVSHELRSPLARLQAASDLARQQPERLQASLDRIDRETERLDQLIGQLLTLSRLEAGTSDEEPADFDLAGLLRDVVADADFEARAQQRAVRFTLAEGSAPVEVRLREGLIYRACENVVRNAVKFTAEGSSVEVVLRAPARSAQVSIEVMDRGPGVPADQLDSLFKPFFRAANARGVDGYGLGLAIVQQSVLMHQGSVRARAREGGGLVIEIRLPRTIG